MTSEYAYTIHQQRHELVSALVGRLLPVQAEDDNYGLALDFCLQKAYYHSFLHTNPRETEEFYAGMVSRLEADSQLTKAAALSALTSKLLALKLPPSPAGVPDLNHSLLQLLASLSGHALSSSLELTPDVLDLLYQPARSLAAAQQQQQQHESHQQAHSPAANRFQRLLLKQAPAGRLSAEQHLGAGSTASSDDDAGGSEYDPYGDDSSLSDWGDSGDRQHKASWTQEASSEVDEQQQPQQPGEEVEEEQDNDAGVARQGRQDPAQAGQPAAEQSAALQSARRLAVQPLPPGCAAPGPQHLLTKLMATATQHKGRPLLHQLCFTQHFLAQQVLRVLQGLPAQGFLLLDPRDLSNTGSMHAHQLSDSAPSADNTSNNTNSSISSKWSDSQHFAVDLRVTSPCLSAASLRALLSEVAAAGSHARQLRALVQQLAFSNAVGNGVPVTPCLRALGVALQQQLDLLGMQLAHKQQELQTNCAQLQQLSQQQQQHHQQQARLSQSLLFRLVRRDARPVMRRLRLLHRTVFGVLQQLSGLPAAVSAGLIDGLADSVREVSSCSDTGPESAAGAAALLHLLLSSCVPLTRALAQWLSCASDGAVVVQQQHEEAAAAAAGGSGEERLSLHQQQQQQQGGFSVCSQDFFIVRRASQDLSAVDPGFWHTAYGFSSQSLPAPAAAVDSSVAAAAVGSLPGNVCCPSFLASLVNGIMTAGKSMRLLDYMEQQELKHSNLSSSNSASSSSSSNNTHDAAGSSRQVGLGPMSVTSQLQQAAGNAAAPRLQHQPGTPRRRRPSSAGARFGGSTSSSSAAGGAGGAAAAGRLIRQASLTLTGTQHSRLPARPASGSSNAALVSRDAEARSSSRKKWGDTTPPAAAAAAVRQTLPPGADAGAVAGSSRSGVSRSVQLQLAAAAAVAGRQAREELPNEFISTACYVLQQEAQLQQRALDQVQHYYDALSNGAGTPSCGSGVISTSSTSSSGQNPGGCTTAAHVLMPRLKAVANCLAQPNDKDDTINNPGTVLLQHRQALGGHQEQQQQQSPHPHHQQGVMSLREAMAALRAKRLAGAAAAVSCNQDTACQQGEQQQQQTAAAIGDAEASASCTGAMSAAAAGQVVPVAAAACADGAAGAVDVIVEAVAQDDCTAAGCVDSMQQQEHNSAPADTASAAAANTPLEGSGVAGEKEEQEEVPDAQAQPAAAPAAASTSVEGEVNISSSGPVSPDVPRLTAWHDQLEGRLTAAGQQLQRMAPWQCQEGATVHTQDNGSNDTKQQQQQERAGDDQQSGSSRKSTSKKSSSWLLRAAETKAPGHFRGSLAELWPFKPVVGGLTSSNNNSSAAAPWLRGAAWPGTDLAWLLHSPPRHLPAVEQLMYSALVQPVQARVELIDRQLMSSLMGEWGMLQQLQGLINVFLVASPAVVEWVDACFAAVEAAKPSASNAKSSILAGAGSRPSSASSSSGTAGAQGHSAVAAADKVPAVSSGGNPIGVGVEDLDMLSVEAMLQDCVLSAGPDDVLPDINALLLTFNKEALKEYRRTYEQACAEGKGRVKAAATALKAANAVTAGSGDRPKASSGGAEDKPSRNANSTGGLMLCSHEWVGLELQHAGSWQLSLVYTDEQLKFFSQVWNIMVQLRWVRRRVHWAAHMACKGGAAVNQASARDRAEAALVAAAAAAAQSSTRSARIAGGVNPGSSSSGQAAAAGLLQWLSGREELLLLQEMGCFMTQWQGFVLQTVMGKLWPELEQVLCTAKGLDQVLTATKHFFNRVCALCNLQAPGTSKAHCRLMRTQLDGLMDAALSAAAAAGRVHAARSKLKELQGMAGREADMQPWWLELGTARSRLRQAGEHWRGEVDILLGTWVLLRKSNPHALDELPDTLDMNGYFEQKVEAALKKLSSR